MIALTGSTVDYASNAFWVEQWDQAWSDAPDVLLRTDMDFADGPPGPNAYFWFKYVMCGFAI